MIDVGKWWGLLDEKIHCSTHPKKVFKKGIAQKEAHREHSVHMYPRFYNWHKMQSFIDVQPIFGNQHIDAAPTLLLQFVMAMWKE